VPLDSDLSKKFLD